MICDLDALDTLPDREIRCGRGEMAKYHFLTGDDLLAMGEAERIARCVEIKAEVVGSDEREGGRTGDPELRPHPGACARNSDRHRLAHGEAVAIGLIYAAQLGRELGRIDDARVKRTHRGGPGRVRARRRVPSGLDPVALVDVMGRDKKALGGLTFVLDGANGVEVVTDVARNRPDAPLADVAADSMIRTDRLILRRWSPPDRGAFAAINSDPLVMETLGPPLTREQSDAFIDRIEAAFDERGFGLWCVEVVDGPRCIGYVGLWPIPADVVPDAPVEIGWRIASDQWGNGYAPEAAAAVLVDAFGRLGLAEIASITAVVNHKSRRVMDKIGLHRDMDARLRPSAVAGRRSAASPRVVSTHRRGVRVPLDRPGLIADAGPYPCEVPDKLAKELPCPRSAPTTSRPE